MLDINKFNEGLFEMIGGCRRVKNSRAAAVAGKECQMIVSNNPNRSKAASVSGKGINKVKVIADFLSSMRY